MPEKVAGKGMSWTAKLGIAAVIMVAVICIIVFIVSSISHKVSYRVEQKNLEKLESLYQSGDYEGICEYLKTVEYTYQSYFDKYTEIAGMQRYLNYLNDEDDSYLQWIVENDKADALSNISYIVSILMNVRRQRTHITSMRKRMLWHITKNIGLYEGTLRDI